MPADNENYESLVNFKDHRGSSSAVSETIEKYIEIKDIVVEWYNQHIATFKDLVANAGANFSDFVQDYSRALQGFLAAAVDTRPTSILNGSHISGLFALSILFLTISSVGSFIGSFLANAVLSYVFFDVGAALIALLFVPLIATYYFNTFNIKSLSDNKRRIVSACFILEQGIMIGFYSRDSFLDSPLILLTQVIASFVFPIVLSQNVPREQVLLAVAGSSILAHFLHGALFGAVSTGFLFLAIGYTAIALLLIQFTLAYRSKIDFDDIYITMHYTFLIAGFKMIGLHIFGLSADEYSRRYY